MGESEYRPAGSQCVYFTAPMVSPRTNRFCAAQPAITTGRHASVAAADSFAKNWPRVETIVVTQIGTVCERNVVRFTARKNSFQAKMKHNNAVADFMCPRTRTWYRRREPRTARCA